MCKVEMVATETFKPRNSIERHFILEVVRSYSWQWPVQDGHVQVHEEAGQIVVQVNFRDRLSQETIETRMFSFRQSVEETLKYLPLLAAYDRAVKAMAVAV